METIKIPESVADMTMKQLPFFLAIQEMDQDKLDIDDLKPHEMADLNTLFFNHAHGHFDRFTAGSNRDMLINLMDACSKQTEEKIRPEIKVGDTVYVWQDDYTKMPVSWHRDASNANFRDYPQDLIGLCYVEKDMIYNELEKKTKVVLNERRSRGEKLMDKFTLQQYLKVLDFFLQSQSVLAPYLKVTEAVRSQSSVVGTGKTQ